MATLDVRIHGDTSLGTMLKGYLLDKGTKMEQEARPVHESH
jgi:hypothetical protein